MTHSSMTYRGRNVKDMTREDLEEAVIFLSELNRKLAAAAEAASSPRLVRSD